jgi:hypothetical protein
MRTFYLMLLNWSQVGHENPLVLLESMRTIVSQCINVRPCVSDLLILSFGSLFGCESMNPFFFGVCIVCAGVRALTPALHPGAASPLRPPSRALRGHAEVLLDPLAAQLWGHACQPSHPTAEP